VDQVRTSVDLRQELKSVVFLSAERLQMTNRTFVTNSGPARIKEH
jgi:hypothetical protein